MVRIGRSVVPTGGPRLAPVSVAPVSRPNRRNSDYALYNYPRSGGVYFSRGWNNFSSARYCVTYAGGLPGWRRAWLRFHLKAAPPERPRGKGKQRGRSHGLFFFRGRLCSSEKVQPSISKSLFAFQFRGEALLAAFDDRGPAQCQKSSAGESGSDCRHNESLHSCVPLFGRGLTGQKRRGFNIS